MAESLVAEKKEIKKLVELNDELENYFRNTIIPQLFVDADLILRKFSPPAHKYFKFADTDIGRSIQEIASLKRVPDLVENIKEVIETNQDIEKEVQTEDKRWFQMNILPYIIKKQNMTNGVVITFIDITDRIRDLKDIERLNADHETFIYSVSHDFRGPLTNMILLIDLLKSVSNSDDKIELNRLIKMMDKSSREMRTMINEITDITKIGSDLSDQAESVNFENILQDIKFTLKDKIHQSHAKITTNILVSELNISRKNLRSIMYNLLSNAIKFTSPGQTPEVLVKTEKSGEYTLLSVKDNGVGIAEDKQQEIFSRFTRLRPDVEGSGVGLYIVSKMIGNHGGKIEVESKVDKGTTFKIYLKG